jgi:hypothetical protein
VALRITNTAALAGLPFRIRAAPLIHNHNPAKPLSPIAAESGNGMAARRFKKSRAIFEEKADQRQERQRADHASIGKQAKKAGSKKSPEPSSGLYSDYQ